MTTRPRFDRFFARGRAKAIVVAVFLLPMFAVGTPSTSAAPVVILGSTTAQFAVLGGTTVTNTGSTVVTGDLGVSPGAAVVGFPPGVVNGTIHAADAVALQAQNELTTAYNTLDLMPSTTDLTGQDLGGLTLQPGVYSYDTSGQLTGNVTFDGAGDPDAFFLVQFGSTLTTASAASVTLMNGARACNIYWQVGSSATLGTTTQFAGNILALESITANTGTDVLGRLLARNAAVTLDTNDILLPCDAAVAPRMVTKTASPTSRPAPGGDFTFTVEVENTGTTSATLTTLTDSIYGNLNGQGTCATGGTIASGATYTCAFSGTFTGAAGDSETDVVTATLTYTTGSTTGTDDATVTITRPTGILEICKLTDNVNGPVKGNFSFRFAGRSVTVPANTCTGPMTVPAGNLTVTEVARAGTALSGCSTRPYDRLLQCNLANRSAVVRIVAGGVAQETVLYMTNRAAGPTPPSTTSTTYRNLGTAPVKVCKVAGSGVPVGTTFWFDVGGRTFKISAGPASQGGYCKIAYGFPLGSNVTVTEAQSPNGDVQGISVRPPDRRVSSSVVNQTVTIRIERGFTVVTFTNAVRQ
jgi:uncharacterized repeat protein (TIGR01451 family)